MSYGANTGYDLTESTKVTAGGGAIGAGEPESVPQKVIVPDHKDRKILEQVKAFISSGEDYRDNFITRWQAIQDQLELVKPAAWANKEDWQSKVIIDMQNKTSETVKARAMKILFPKRFFAISGVEESDRVFVSDLVMLMMTLIERGHGGTNFYIQNNDGIKETGELGTSGMKVTAVPSKDSISFQWRSIYNFLVDPSARGDISKMKFFIDESTKDMGDIVGNKLYDKAAVKELLKIAQTASANKGDEELEYVRNVDGTGTIQIPQHMKKVTIQECWCEIKVPLKEKRGDDWINTANYKLEKRVVTVANGQVVLRNDPNEYGRIPAFFTRMKKRLYDFYAKGYLLNTLDIQNLTNSIMNLGFDSLKINSMDIIKLNVNMVDDANSIEYKPLAIWRMRDVKGAEISRGQRTSSIMDTMRGAQYMDQVHQDVTGINRGMSGANALHGQSGSQTLGEYESKLENIGERFLGEMQPIEAEYIVPLLKQVYNIVSNPKLFSQKAINDIVGVDIVPITDPLTQEPVGEKEVPRLDQKELASRDFSQNFIATGVTQISQALEAFARLQRFMATVIADPLFRGRIKDEPFLRRLAQALQVQDPEEILRTDEEMQQEQVQSQIQQQQQAQQPQGGGGAPDAGGALTSGNLVPQ